MKTLTLADEARNLADILAKYDTREAIAAALTLPEAEALARLMVAAGRPSSAQELMLEWALSDSESIHAAPELNEWGIYHREDTPNATNPEIPNPDPDPEANDWQILAAPRFESPA